DEASVTRRWRVDCGARDLAGAAVAVRGLDTAQAPALVRIVLADGRVVQGVVTARVPELVIPAAPERPTVLRDYLRLGVEHILSGADHVLFVLGLCLLARGGRRLAATVTAFTLGHSITLALVVRDVLRVPAAPVELAIALSVFLVAAESAHRRPTRLGRAPWAMAGGFGLLHGLGFAAALRTAGLPSGEVPAALVAFNVGVEAGQLLVVAAVLLARAAVERAPIAWPAWVRWAPAYAMGSIAALWCFERAAALVG
ncbi:MAG TPA: HupE/UreJ family protein, partial [Candidatus Binatia bacterium]|nr:HupE/UreJ family protein [Candidatus Binatia bacterium]